MNTMEKSSFQRLCIRPEVGYAYDSSSMVELADGGSFTELLCRVTSKCDTNLLLLSSHKGKIKDFAVKLIGITAATQQSYSVLSSIKKGLSFLGTAAEDDAENKSDEEQISEAWQESYSLGYHGLQVVTLIDKEAMPDNVSRKLYSLHQFVTIILQSINAYYMFQKPDVSFVYDTGYTAKELEEQYPKADTYALALIWKFVDDPTANSLTGLKRATPIIGSNMRTSETPLSARKRRSLLDSEKIKTSLQMPSLTPKPSPLLTDKKNWLDRNSDKIKTLQISPVAMIKNNISSAENSMEETSEEEEEEMVENQAQEAQEDEESEDEIEERSMPVTSVVRCPKPAPARGRNASKSVVPRATVPVKKTATLPVPSKPSAQIMDRGTRRGRATAQAAVVIEVPAVREIKNNAKKQKVIRTSTRGSKRTIQVVENDSENEEDEISLKSSAEAAAVSAEVESMEVDENTDTSNTCYELAIKPEDIALPSQESGSAKPRVGRKSMVASARKSLANEWPVTDQDHMLHFFDNLNPTQSEQSRVALTCKYALLQYNRDLSSKLLYQWIERKGRPIQRQVTDFSLKEDAVKGTVLELFKSLSDVQTEATRVSFTLKFMQSQYGASVTSKQLYGWLNEKPKKGGRR